MSNNSMRVRRSIADIQSDWESGANQAELEALMRAWQGIKQLDPSDPNSFFVIGGFHGEPFRGEGVTSRDWWGGYCQHGTVLFPSWHRAYMLRIEDALGSIPGCEDVTLPFWDETSAQSRQNGIPSCLTDETFTFSDGTTIENPLRSFVLPADITDTIDDDLYTKAAGYRTVRYPLSGLVGTPNDRTQTAAHNARFPTAAQQDAYLNDNITTWLNQQVTIPGGGGTWGLIYQKFVNCLSAPNYTLFSNTTSARAHSNANPKDLVTPLESPHNYMHLAVGGFDVPGQGTISLISGANGDMGENNTAALDPIFFFHHCFIDYVFWIWQRRTGATDSFTIDPADPGAVYGKNNPPPAYADPDQPIGLDTPLKPFVKSDGQTYTTADCINVETQLGYTYGPGSLDGFAHTATLKAMVESKGGGRNEHPTVHIDGIDRSKYRGSMLIATWAEVNGTRELVDVEPVLNRWTVAGCANCQTKLEVSADAALPEGADPGTVTVEVHTRDGIYGHGGSQKSAGGLLKEMRVEAPAAEFRVEIR